MAQFDRAIDTALRLIKKNGQIVSWVKKTAFVPYPDQPWLPQTSTIITYSPFICFLPLDLQGTEFLNLLGVGDAASGSYYGLMGQVGFTPSLEDIVVRDGVTLDIKSIDLLSPNGQKVLYTVIFKG